MAVVDDLMNAASADEQLLHLRQTQSDDNGSVREVDFSFVSDREEQARIVASFLGDFYRARTACEPVNGEFRVTATLDIPTSPSVLLAVSGFMACIGALFTVRYDGWGAVILPG